ncbi:MAG: 3-oxoacyl-[acyl-carrier-protein] reductase [Holophagales bacterium]|nr:3-oxoacyl-[acyl-carrier-protein] reductase [Holophagales bacterium]MYD21222.1 3-oxoacyl-[acyl-carrier-protein] reductase [Holophagales bacterium]MYI31642.1 3-oxoacyl-[acyl-carrier-protein] reductase [Holophagales bacterium]
MVFDLKGRTALVTGASRGIGRAAALLLARQGARVVLAARNEELLDEVAGAVRANGGDAHPMALDLADHESIPAAVRGLPAEFAAVDILVNNAGITADNLLARMTLVQWQRVLDVNLTGAFVLTKALVRGMMRRRHGRVVSVSSVAGVVGNAGQANYAASKAGLIGFSKSLARELLSRGITVNVVAPGFIETDMTAALPDGAGERFLEQHGLVRLGTVDDIAAAVLYLASDEASYVTGEVLSVSGGMT